MENFDYRSILVDNGSIVQWWALGPIKKKDKKDNYDICLENICLFVQSRGVVMVTLSG